MSKIILFPTHEEYCTSCTYYDSKHETCRSEKYNRNIGKVISSWGFCKYRSPQYYEVEEDGRIVRGKEMLWDM